MNRQLLTLARPVRKAQRRLFERCSYLLSLLRPYQPLAGGKQLLDTEYAEGVWSYLKDLDELSRFSVVAGYCHYFADRGAILEIGCGAGTLQERLCPEHYSRYVGIDISSEALARAAPRVPGVAMFVEADASSFVPDAAFDLILFNECLEYFADPVCVVRRYEPYLASHGLFILSMFLSPASARTRKIWKALDGTGYRTVSATTVTNHTGYTWVIKVVQPPAISARERERAGEKIFGIAPSGGYLRSVTTLGTNNYAPGTHSS
jgi:SAM-dependent methyltransferase